MTTSLEIITQKGKGGNMAQKRMFDKRITDSDRFTDLPNSSKALYFMAGMSADDRGFFQPRRLQKMNGFTDDDFKVLIAKGYFIPFESGVMVITDWNKNNWLDKRRITETEYIEELKLLRLINERYELDNCCLASAEPMLRENSIEQNRIVENRIEQLDGSCDEAEELCTLIEKNFNRTISPLEYEKVKDWIETFSKDTVEQAIEQAVMNGKKTFNYINGILKNWKSNEIPKPKWMDKEIESQELTPEEQKEFDDLIANF